MNHDLELLAALVIAASAALITSGQNDYIPGGNDLENKTSALELNVSSLRSTSRTLKAGRVSAAGIQRRLTK